MKKISGRKVRVQQSDKEIDWKSIAILLAADYMKSRCMPNDKNRNVSVTG